MNKLWRKEVKDMKNIKRVAAMAGVLLLVGLYVATLVSACLVTPATKNLFLASTVATVMIPILLYALQLIYKWIGNRTEEDR